jgi:sugar-specific transcriptional regulator TrmB
VCREASVDAGGKRLAAKLADLGFSQYEAMAYVGLLSMFGQTAYALAKTTGIPQPKVYEAVRKLVDRQAAVQVGDNPARFAAVPPELLMRGLESGFHDRLEAVRQEMRSYSGKVTSEWPQVVTSITGHPDVLARAAALLDATTRKVYLSGWEPELAALIPNLERAHERHVELIALAFGSEDFILPGAQLYHHASTGGILYPHHQNRHLAVISDGTTMLWATAPNGAEWSAIISDDHRLIGLTRSYIRHDIYVQKIYTHLAPEMEGLFGPGLEYMMDISTNRTLPNTAARRRRQAG